ncbi:hypothetical protein EGH21_16275 [Halomicroarcula sp. F13]|uniref:Uncharacterized protein n=1 Tax=Haloarcula rubra TaxID=2487747 RepID=A0AAW4PVD4_9EURY|nr:hypothetical protein [Halomicroarcula rubra]MBX0324586.1 hypothetical protein [Halomicroarcula rubra]
MPDSLPVHVNREELHGLEVPATFETSESFDVRLVNHGESTHVHLHLDDALSSLASIEAPNHHVERDSERRVRVTLTRDGAVRGKLKVVTAYGATTRYVDVVVTEPDRSDDPVEVDEDLAKPQPKPDPGSDSVLADVPDLPVLAVGGVALLAAVTAAFFVQNVVVLLAALVVVVGVLATVYAVLAA